ncbi:MAG: N-acetylneuraminate synthase family protein [Actinomycetota bacterium]|nr:N-acetylneuraminate synthase family protein [Actinomycetota bacterium]
MKTKKGTELNFQGLFNNNASIGENIFIIAEIGINHNGDLVLAKELIKLAKEAGCDAVKFQKRTIDIVYTQEFLNEERESPWGGTQREQKEGLEFSEDDYKEIDSYAKELDIIWFASAWDIPSQDFLKQFDLPVNKIASAMATNLEFVAHVAKEKKPTFVSTGMTTLEEIDNVVEIFNNSDCPITLMHTNSEYPSPEENLNLNCITTLKERYNLPVGYSGHEPSVSPSLIAACLGATAIERHITKDRSSYGSDQAASLEGVGLKNLVSMIRKIPIVLGDGVKTITDQEKDIAKKLRYWL